MGMRYEDGLFKRANLMVKNIFGAQKANFPVWKNNNVQEYLANKHRRQILIG